MNKKLIKEILKKYSYVKNYDEDKYENENNAVFHFQFCKSYFFLVESCDEWFNMELNSKNCEELSNLFKELSISLKGE